MVLGRRNVIAAFLILMGAQVADAAGSTEPRASFATVTGSTSVPYGWVDFCNRYAGECDGPALPIQDLALTARSFKEIDRVNRQVNRSVKAETDMDHWGVVDQWDYPTDGAGDCEDYALLKRRTLIQAGYPRQSLLITVVKDHVGEGHAVLTVKTDKGEFVLDNMVDTVLPWNETGYRFVKRQSQVDPNIWQSIGAPVNAPLFTANQ